MVALGAMFAMAVPAAANDRADRAIVEVLRDASSWIYQLQDARPSELGKTHHDILVIDAFFGGSRSDLMAMRKKPLGGRRIVLSYLSIGEAEIYRYYWAKCCKDRERPDWLADENKRWKGNFRVKFWHPDWKAIIYEAADSYLKRIVEAGFDGVYLDRIDVHSAFSVPGIDPRAEMIAFVRAISAAAKALKPGFLVVAQNAEDLLADPRYLEAIDGIAKEDLLYGVAGDGRRNDAAMIRTGNAHLQKARAAGKQVLVVEYLDDPKLVTATETELHELGYVPYFAPRGLERPRIVDKEFDDTH